MSCMSGSPNLNSFRDRGQVAVQLVSCGVLLPGLVQDCTYIYIYIYIYMCVYIYIYIYPFVLPPLYELLLSFFTPRLSGLIRTSLSIYLSIYASFIFRCLPSYLFSSSGFHDCSYFYHHHSLFSVIFRNMRKVINPMLIFSFRNKGK